MEKLFDYCRYYKGENECPFDDDRHLFWFYEKKWCDNARFRRDDNSNPNIKFYNDFGLHNFEQNDGTPISLKALLFNRYYYWNDISLLEDGTEPFEQFYKNEYKKRPPKHVRQSRTSTS